MTTSECDGFEITIERESHGASTESESRALAAHLATCERCRAYAEEAARSRRGLAAIASAATGDVDWTKLEAELRALKASRVRRTLTLTAIAPLAIGVSVWGLAEPGARLERAIFDTLTVGAVIGARIAMDVVRTRRLARLAEPAAFFAAHRAELAREIRQTVLLRWVALAVIATFLGLATLPAGHGGLAYALLAAIVAIVWARRLLVELPRKRRELASLDESEPDRSGG